MDFSPAYNLTRLIWLSGKIALNFHTSFLLFIQ